MKVKLALVVVESRVKFMRPMDATAIDDHDDLCTSFAKDAHDLMNILAQLLGIKVRDNFIEDFGGAVLDRAQHTEQHAARDPAPGAIAHPRLAFDGFVALDLALAQRTDGQTRALGAAPPAQPGEGKAPEDRCIFVEHNDLAPACAVLQGSKVERAISEVRWSGIESPRRATGAYRVVFHTPRTLSRPSWTPVSRAKTVASSRQLHWEEIAPCWRGSWSTRRLRCMSSAQVTVGGRPERGRSSRPWGPWLAKR